MTGERRKAPRGRGARVRQTSLAAWGVVALAACPEQGSTPPVASGGTALSYGCTDPPATTGGDHGPEWDWGDSDTGSLELDSASLPPEEDPTMWSVHSASGAYYRSPTEGEMLAYGWDSYTLLVIPPSAFVSGVTGPGGASPPTLVLPVHDFTQSRPQEDLDVVAVQLTLEWAHDRTPFMRSSSAGFRSIGSGVL